MIVTDFFLIHIDGNTVKAYVQIDCSTETCFFYELPDLLMHILFIIMII